MSIESVMPSNHPILCHPLLSPSVFPSIQVFPSCSFLRVETMDVFFSFPACKLPFQRWHPPVPLRTGAPPGSWVAVLQPSGRFWRSRVICSVWALGLQKVAFIHPHSQKCGCKVLDWKPLMGTGKSLALPYVFLLFWRLSSHPGFWPLVAYFFSIY